MKVSILALLAVVAVASARSLTKDIGEIKDIGLIGACRRGDVGNRYASSNNPRKYYECTKEGLVGVKCEKGTFFNADAQGCLTDQEPEECELPAPGSEEDSAETDAPVESGEDSAETDAPEESGETEPEQSSEAPVESGEDSAETDAPVESGETEPEQSSEAPVESGEDSAETDAPVESGETEPEQSSEAPVESGEDSAETDAPVESGETEPEQSSEAPVESGEDSAETDAPVESGEVEPTDAPVESGEDSAETDAPVESGEDSCNVVCSYHGEYLVNPDSCTSFYQCSWGVPYYFDCPFADQNGNRLNWNPTLDTCDWPRDYPCEDKPGCNQPELPETCPEVACVQPHDVPEYHANPADCHSFYQCSNGVPYLHQCAIEDGDLRLVFDTSLNVCNWNRDVPCNNSC